MDGEYYYACGLLYHRASGRALLHHRDARAPSNPNVWDLIGGGREVEDKGDPIATWEREVQEEIGVVLLPEQVRPLADYLTPTHRVRRCVFWYDWPPLTTRFVIGEGDGVGWFDVDDAFGLPDLAAGARRDLTTFVRSLSSAT